MKIKDKYVVVIGCSNFGSHIATSLSEFGNDVVVVDIENKALETLPAEYAGFKILGDATDIGVLKEAKLEEADFLILSTDSDNKNIMIAQIAKEIFNVKKIVSRLYNLEKEVVYKGLDVEIIRPAELVINEFKRILKNEGAGI